MKNFLFILLTVFLVKTAAGQQAPAFWNEILAFKQLDKADPPAQGEILFVGSSSFRMWEHIETAFPGFQIINRGFGGSQLPDVIRYFYDIILPYHPRQVVIYCGENDLMDPGVSAHDVATRFKTLFFMIRNNLPEVPIEFVSIKPSPSRRQVRDAVVAANQMIQNFITSQSRAHYIDVYHEMIDKDGREREGIFKNDLLHLNAQGYAIWQKAILPYLVK